MPWQRDANTGEWVMVDAPIADVRQLDQGPHEAYDTSGDGVYPVLPAADAPTRSPEGGYVQRDVQAIPNAPPTAGAYQNEDLAAIDRWVQEAQARGHEVRRTGVGTFEVDSGGHIVSPMPSPYKVD